MEIVVFRSDIARLVLGYIQNQKLDKAARIFCKSSPHLTEEFSAYKQGLQGYSFFPDLEEIICEYVKITQKVDNILRQLPDSLRAQLQYKKLSDKVIDLLNMAGQQVFGECSKATFEERTTRSNLNSKTGGSVSSEKENVTKRLTPTKRKRDVSRSSTSDEQQSILKQRKYRKRRRIYEPFCFLGGKRMDMLKKVVKPVDHSDENVTASDNDDEEDSLDEHTDNENRIESEDLSAGEVSIMEKPTKESTPRNKFSNSSFQTPTLPEISQAILENTEFQTKLVENINEALQSATKTTECLKDDAEMEQIINTNQLLDDMVKNILAATEKDPAFDAIIEEVVGTHKTGVVDTAVQCDIPVQSKDASADMPDAGMDQQQQLPVNSIAPDNFLNIANIPAPRTPLIIRNAVGATQPASSTNDAQTMPLLPANTSFGSLIDPNFSISKLIVLNSNDSAQKQYPDPANAIGNVTADNLLTQFNNPTTENTLDEQVHLDVATGQLTFPIFITNDGFLTNLPFLINNEMLSQQLQADNISNLENSRIEISLPEPIIVTADQLPPNSKICDSTKKENHDEVPVDCNASNAQKTVSKLKSNALATVPTSLDSRLHTERATPSSCGIVNAKAYKSLSTPRKRASHVRTLTFSPKSLTAHTLSGLATPLSTRRGTMRTLKTVPNAIPEEPKAVEEVSEKAIINNIEILPRITSGNAVEINANESSNSCNVPPLFVTEECSNQTIIKCEASNIKPKTAAIAKTKKQGETTTETPKRKQVRKNAVRACKRQLSKSPNDDGQKHNVGEEAAGSKENQENQKTDENNSNIASKLGVECKQKHEANSDSIDLMEEWKRMRSCSTNNLDSRLREINASKGFPKTTKKVVKRKVRRKKDATKKAKEKQASLEAGEIFQDQQLRETAGIQNETLTSENEHNSSERLMNIILSQSDDKLDSAAKEKDKEKKKLAKEKPKEFTIKILTPQKAKDKKAENSDTKSDKKIEHVDNRPVNALDGNEFMKPATVHQAPPSARKECAELEKRTANIACLLETPFKDACSNAASVVPPTPGIFAHALGTPISKITPTAEDIHSTSFLFGSLTKSELGTPLLSAITPGFRFTPFASKDATPRSVTATEYSSGSSYYRPDESEDLDKNIEKMLRNSAQKETVPLPCATPELDPAAKKAPEAVIKENEADGGSGLCVEIPAATLKVEPIVLKRVKSFGSEAVDTCDVPTIAPVDPHYTLAAGLPELSAVEDECSSSSSSSSSASTSSSSSDSDSESTTSSSSSAADTSLENTTTAAKKQDPDKSLSLEQLSEISSAEDDEWQKLIVTDGEDSQLVAHDGEVRYPVRSWLTPSKQNSTADLPTTSIKLTLPLKSAEKHNRQISELDEKRERIKEKLRSDISKQNKEKTVQYPKGAMAVKTTKRNLQVIHKTQKTTKPPAAGNKKKGVHVDVPAETRTLDVLTALNLSAKKNDTTAQAQSAVPTSTEKKEKPTELNLDNKKENAPKANVRRKCQMIEATAIAKPKKKPAVVRKLIKRPITLKKSSATTDRDGEWPAKQTTPLASKTKSTTRTSVRLSQITTKKTSIKTIPKVEAKKELSPKKKIKEEPIEKAAVATKAVAKAESLAATATKEIKYSSLINPARAGETPSHGCKQNEQSEVPKAAAIAKKDIVKQVPATPSLIQAETPVAAASKQESENDMSDDSLEDCVVVNALFNEKFSFHVISDETTVRNTANSKLPIPSTTSNYTMSLEIEDQGAHTLRVSEEICLFSANPTQISANAKETQSIKTIPKKRRIRVMTSDDSDGTNKETATSSSNSTKSKTNDKSKITSTPVVQKKQDVSPMTADANKKNEPIPAAPTPISSSDINIEVSSANAADKLKIDDIETILSQIHGT